MVSVRMDLTRELIQERKHGGFHLGQCDLGRLLDILVFQLFGGNSRRFVANARKAANAHAERVTQGCFGHGGHANRISAQNAKGPDFRRGFECRSGKGDVYTFVDWGIILFTRLDK